ncbi:MAG: EAL domain-containing protein [Lachnospiraceae bacterium]|nr:EAL domain-containing protein [Lachnospiraceae bacterium]
MENTLTSFQDASFFIVASIICFTTSFFQIVEGRTKKMQNKIFLLLLVITLTGALSSLVVVFTRPYLLIDDRARLLSDISQYFYFLFHTLMPVLFYLYVALVSGVIYAQKPIRTILILAPCLLAEALVVVNPAFHLVYYYALGHRFTRAWGEFVIYIVSAFYLMTAIFHLLRYWRMLTFRRRWALLYSFGIAVLGIVLQLLSIKLLVELLFESMAFAGLMFTVEKEDDRIDETTGVYNRSALRADLANYLRLNTRLRMICVRITNSDILQRITGSADSDAMLHDVAEYLSSVHSIYNIYRAHSSAFLLVCRDFDEKSVRNLAFDITRRFDRPWSGHGTDLRLKAVLLIAEMPEEYRSVDDVFLICDGALPPSENRRILSGEELGFLKREVQVEEALIRGLAEHNFEVQYQPLYDLHSRSIHAAEALLLLHDSKMGFILPDEFMPVAVKNDIIGRLSTLIIEEVFLFLSSGIPTEMGLQSIHVGLSAYQCLNPSFLDDLRKSVRKYNVNASFINFEMRKFASADDFMMLQKVLADVREMGFKLSLDRFGMEDSNLQTLSSIDFDVVNMDMKMMGTRQSDEDREIGYRIVENSVRMIGQMHKQILIRNISTQEQVDLLSGMDVDYLQGDYYSKPVSQNELISILRVTEVARKEEQEARAQSQAKSSFLANMSHEIRTPINAILGMNEMILRETDDDNIRTYAMDIERAGNSLLSLINDILDFSKIEAGSMEIVLVEYGLSSVINDVTNLMQGKIAQKNLEFKLDVDETLPETLYGDEMRIRQIMVNLLNNAVKYTQHGSVTLSVHGRNMDEDSLMLMIDIIDTGIGIKEEDIGRLFGTFQRVDMDKNRTVEGTGLGLAITRNLLDLMSGRIEVKSEYGSGSTFSVQLPQMVLDRKPIGDLKERYRKHVENLAGYRESFTAPDARILVVDDTPMNLTVVKGLLKQTLLQIETAISGRECLEMVQKTQYDCIFLDYRMPEMDGTETLKRIRELKGYPNSRTPVIVLTANALSGAREQFLAEGFDDYLTKPVEARKLEQMLMQYLPDEKLHIVVMDEDDGKNMENESIENDEELERLHSLIPEIHIEEGLERCGGREPYLQALEIYSGSVDAKYGAISRYFETEDWANYTIQVHSLKSTSRVIGALDLGEDAWEMEQAGDRQDVELIREKTPDLLERLKSLGASLAEFEGGAQEDDADLPPIDERTLTEAWEALLDFARQMDYEDGTFVLDELKSYRLPPVEKERMKEITAAWDRLDWDAVTGVLEGALHGGAGEDQA